jgi:hypothetical protein
LSLCLVKKQGSAEYGGDEHASEAESKYASEANERARWSEAVRGGCGPWFEGRFAGGVELAWRPREISVAAGRHVIRASSFSRSIFSLGVARRSVAS